MRVPSFRCAAFSWPFVVLLASATVTAQNGEPRNSTRKIRAQPSALAARAGSAIPWRSNFAAARRESAETGKPVFWYVPTVERSPMDRKPEVDRYMMAGPFSWPTTIALLTDHFVPVRHAATRDEQKEYALAPRDFIEPGYVVLDSEGEEVLRLDQITTFERVWFETPLARLVGVMIDPAGPWARLPSALPRDREPSDPAVLEATPQSGDGAAEWAYLRGVAEWNAGARAAAKATWEQLGRDFPEHPYAWKAAAEAEGHGPYTAGFELLRQLPSAATAGSGDGSRVVEGAYDEAELWARGVQFLLRMRTPAGGIEDSEYDFGGTDSLPNVYVACTALCGWAMLEHAVAHDESLRDEVWPFFDYVADDSHLNPVDRDEITWAHTYRMRFYGRLLDLCADHPRAAEVRRALERALAALAALQTDRGAWFHEYSNPFVTASALLALREAERHGVGVDREQVERGLKALLSCRTDEGAYSYGMPRRGRPRSSVPSAIGRMALGELALAAWGVGEQPALAAALDASFEHHGLLAEVRKYDDHSNRHGHGGFFFWYDMRARSEAIARLEDDAERARAAARQRALILSLPEIDGCFVDSHELGRCYGTAMALLALRALEP